MINKKIEDIQESDLTLLQQNGVKEGKGIEYKKTLPGNSDSDKKEFLADISSFANTNGGDLIYGVEEDGGIPTAFPGLEIVDPDSELLRLENIIRDGLNPRIQYSTVFITLSNSKRILIFRVRGSWIGPHRAIFQGWDKFFARNDSGKYSLDVTELRNAFLQTSSVIERIKEFRINRVFEVTKGSPGLPIISEQNFVAIHLIPLSAFTSGDVLDSKQLLALKEGRHNAFQPFYNSGWSHKINLDGVVAYCGATRDKYRTYAQLYRNGILEAVESGAFSGLAEDSKVIPMIWLEKGVADYISKILSLYKELGFQPPFYAFLSIVGVKGFVVSTPERVWGLDLEQISKNELLLPEVVIENYEDNLLQKFRPVYDMIWNASGVSKSLNFNDDGDYIAR